MGTALSCQTLVTFSRHQVFRSGFESATVLTGPTRSAGGAWVEALSGVDAGTGFSWPTDLPGGRESSRLYYVVAGDQDLATVVETRLDRLAGPRGELSQALYQGVLRDHQSLDSRARNMFVVINNDGDDLAQGYLRYWLKLQPDLEAQLRPDGAWRQVMEWREKDNHYRMAVLIQRDGSTGRLYWTVHGDAGPGWSRDWTIENRAVAVPVGTWFLWEAHWRHSTESDGRLLLRAACQVVADHLGATRRDGPLEGLHAFKVYAATESLAVGPAYQWIDEVELRRELELATCP